MNKPKFRAWDKVDQKMRMVEELCFDSECVTLEDFLNGKKWHSIVRNFEEVILMQYTGLKDKNGKQYCQDDLVRYEGKIYRLIKGTYAFELVGFYEASQDNPCDYFSEQAYYFGEIIGNIHANPELLNEVE